MFREWMVNLALVALLLAVPLMTIGCVLPLRPIKVGPDPSLPILPANLSNAFTR